MQELFPYLGSDVMFLNDDQEWEVRILSEINTDEKEHTRDWCTLVTQLGREPLSQHEQTIRGLDQIRNRLMPIRGKKDAK